MSDSVSTVRPRRVCLSKDCEITMSADTFNGASILFSGNELRDLSTLFQIFTTKIVVILSDSKKSESQKN